MTTSAKYQLYIRTTCSDCDKILIDLESQKINVPVINIDNDDYQLPFNLAIFPALVMDKSLISYGYDDIISCLKTA